LESMVPPSLLSFLSLPSTSHLSLSDLDDEEASQRGARRQTRDEFEMVVKVRGQERLFS
jgi:hypothetical protein